MHERSAIARVKFWSDVREGELAHLDKVKETLLRKS